jgi:hypothetical protein
MSHGERPRVDSDKDRMTMELSRMISELNEVRMRLDSVVRKIAETSRMESGDDEAVESLERLRLALASQLDRIRYKLIARMPEPT